MTKLKTLHKYNDTHLRREIDALLDQQEAADEILHPQTVALDVCKAHREGLVEDEDSVDVAFWMFTGYFAARKLATECINARDDDDEATNTFGRRHQPLLPYDGFERTHLQDHYNVVRAGEHVGVQTRDLTDTEAIAKANFYFRLSSANAAHGEEILRYVEFRRPKDVAVALGEVQNEATV